MDIVARGALMFSVWCRAAMVGSMIPGVEENPRMIAICFCVENSLAEQGAAWKCMGGWAVKSRNARSGLCLLAELVNWPDVVMAVSSSRMNIDLMLCFS